MATTELAAKTVQAFADTGGDPYKMADLIVTLRERLAIGNEALAYYAAGRRDGGKRAIEALVDMQGWEPS